MTRPCDSFYYYTATILRDSEFRSENKHTTEGFSTFTISIYAVFRLITLSFANQLSSSYSKPETHVYACLKSSPTKFQLLVRESFGFLVI